MITLYHGSYIEVKSPNVQLGRKLVDFGQGFYLTKLRSQAESWSRTIAERKGRNARPVLSVFTLDLDEVVKLGYRVKCFDSYDMEWLDYVVDCRNGGNLQEKYDVVEGGVANDNVIDTVENYENGVISVEQALGQLRYKEVNHQLCIRSQEILDGFLSFVKSEELSQEEE